MFTSGLRAFIEKHHILGLAIGIIAGTAVGKVVASLAADVMMPLINPLIPGGEWRAAQIVLSRSVAPDGKEVIDAINYGNFRGTVVDFVVIAFCVYMITKAFLKEAPAAPTKECPECAQRIPAAAKRSKYCTAAVG